MNQTCRECGGASFSVNEGLKICDQCGTQQKGYVELQSEEYLNEIDHSRFLNCTILDDEVDGGQAVDDGQKKEEQLNNWTTYDAYNVVLHEWTKALCGLGASAHFQETVFKLWAAYLHCNEVTFLPKNWKGDPKCSVLPNKRDLHLIHRMRKSVSHQDMAFRRAKRKTPKESGISELERIKNKCDRVRLRRRRTSDSCASVMSRAVSMEMSRSLTEMETSSVFSDLSGDLSAHHEDSTSPEKSEIVSDVSTVSTHLRKAKRKLSTPHDNSSHDQDLNSLESESEPQPRRQKKVLYNRFVRRWLENQEHIYGIGEENSSDSDEVRESLFTIRSETRTSRKRAFRRKVRRKALQISEQQKSFMYSTQPVHMTFEKLLGLLYLAVLMSKEQFFLMDIIRWCREGHIPYMSAYYLLKPNMKLFWTDLQMMRQIQSVPTADKVQGVAGKLAVFLSIQSIPLPDVGNVISRLVKVLRLPESVGTLAKSIIKLKDRITVAERFRVPAVESLAMASIIVVLKAFCGANDNYETRLSHAASKINKVLLPSGITAPLFSWDEWERYICCVIWFCSQVDAVSALNCQQFKQLVRMESSQFSKFFWNEGLWRNPQTTLTHNKTLSLITRKVLDYQGDSLEKVLDQPSVFKATLQPFMSIIEQFVQQHKEDKQQNVQKLVMIAEELMTKSFHFHTLEWTCRLETVQKNLEKCNSNISVVPEVVTKQKENGTNGNSMKTASPKHKPRQKPSDQKSTLIIPQPLKHIWESPDQMSISWNTFSSSLPASFKWLINLGTLVCETKERQIYCYIKMLEKHTRKF